MDDDVDVHVDVLGPFSFPSLDAFLTLTTQHTIINFLISANIMFFDVSSKEHFS